MAVEVAVRCKFRVYDLDEGDETWGAGRICDRVAVCVYTDPKDPDAAYPLCSRHDTKKAVLYAAEIGLRRVDLT